MAENTLETMLAEVRTESGRTLLELSEESPLLLVFLRHFGCTFCRQAISDIAEISGRLGKLGVRPVFVHLGPTHVAAATFAHYGLSDVERVNDPDAKVYRASIFGLGRSNPASHFFKLGALKGWFVKGALFKYGFGRMEGDGTQMPGAFFLKDKQIVRKFVHKSIADRPDYLRLVR